LIGAFYQTIVVYFNTADRTIPWEQPLRKGNTWNRLLVAGGLPTFTLHIQSGDNLLFLVKFSWISQLLQKFLE
jgi:hypothetical protein